MTQKNEWLQRLVSGCSWTKRLRPSLAASKTSQEAFFFFSFYACQNCRFPESPWFKSDSFFALMQRPKSAAGVNRLRLILRKYARWSPPPILPKCLPTRGSDITCFKAWSETATSAGRCFSVFCCGSFDLRIFTHWCRLDRGCGCRGTGSSVRHFWGLHAARAISGNGKSIRRQAGVRWTRSGHLGDKKQ